MFNILKSKIEAPATNDAMGVATHNDYEGRVNNEEVKLQGGAEVYVALISKDTIVLDEEEVRQARNKLAEISLKFPEEVKKCNGKTEEECREILKPLID